MTIDATKLRVLDVADLPVKNADGSPMLQENGEPVTATVFGPATKIWQNADAHRRRKAVKRSRENKGKYEAAIDHEVEDTIEFLCTITKRFNGMGHGDTQGDKEIVVAIYNDPSLGYIRDHMDDDAGNWESFMKAQQSLSNSGPSNLPG
jgi:hypothetical protein